jgi:hypothetical protein
MQFQVNGREYFLAFVEDERRWYLFSPSNTQGLQRIPVYVDAAKPGRASLNENGRHESHS